MKIFFCILLFLGGSIVALFLGLYVLWQHDAITAFVPTRARIVSSTVTEHRGSKGSVSYSPDITYTYRYKGVEYTSTDVLTLSATGSLSWADDIVARYPPQLVVLPDFAVIPQAPPPADDAVGDATAYVNPDNPAEAILVRDYFLSPYVFLAVAIYAAELGLAWLFGMPRAARSVMSAVALDDSGRQLLLPDKSLRRRFIEAGAWFAMAAFALLPPLAHWTLVAHVYDFRTAMIATIFGAFLLILGIVLFNRWSLTRHLSDARVSVNPAPMRRGEPLSLEVEADACTPLHVSAFTANLTCTEHYREKRGNKTELGTRSRYNQILNLGAHADLPAGQVLKGNGQITCTREEAPPTTDRTAKQFPYYTWHIRIDVALKGTADYRAIFPLRVE